MAGEHVFVDETKRGGYLLVAARLRPEQVDAVRGRMRALLLKGQSHVHFTKERDDRRGEIVRALCSSGLRIQIYRATAADQRKAREACLRQLVADLADAGAHRLVIEQDDSLVRTDQAVLYSAVRQVGLVETLTYAHLPKRAEPLLWAADAAAWCWSHAQWRARIRPIVDGVRTLP